MYEYETSLTEKGYHFICGVDEAGRGPLAGPVVAGAVILNQNDRIEGLNDSKQLTDKKRRLLFNEIKQRALAYGIGFVFPDEIDRINIYQASKKAMLLAIEAMAVKPDCLLTDAMPITTLAIPVLPIIKGDTLSASIAAGSILAKVTRDDYMIQMASTYPHYGFDVHKGYPTKQHKEALALWGVTPLHRKSYHPVKTIIEQQLSLNL